MKDNEKLKNQFIKECHAKLQWYMNEAIEEEFDCNEVKKLVDLLQILDPIKPDDDYFTAEKSLERFWKSHVFSNETHLELRKISEPSVSSHKKFTILSNNFRKTAAAAATLVMTLFIGGTIGACAQKEGYFKTIQSNFERNATITSADDTYTESEKYMIYEDINNVPIGYLQYIWMPVKLPEGFSFKISDLYEDDSVVKMKCQYKDPSENLFIDTVKCSYKDNITIIDQYFDGYEFYCEKKYGDIDVEYMIKENDDYTEYIAKFSHGNSTYSFSSNIDFDTIECILSENITLNNF